jgi:hypothetical protein
MKLFFARILPGFTSLPRPFKDAALAATIAIGLATLPCAAQTAPSATPAPQQAKPAIPPHQGKIIFSRSSDGNGQTTQTVPAAVLPANQAFAPSAQDGERRAVTFSGYSLDVHLHPADQQIAVRALVTVRNDGKTPLARIPLEISSSLNWEEIRLHAPGGQESDVAFQAATVNSDADHTGQLHEAAVPLAKPLAPGQTLQLDVTYSGQIALSAQRLQAIGAPGEVALHSDWDQISASFTGLRGFGNVVWYPVVSAPVLLGDGARLFDEIGEQKLRLVGAHFRLRLTIEFPHGQAPTIALINGHSVPLAVTESGAFDQSQEVDGVATADSGSTILGFEAPCLFVAIRKPHPGANLIAWTLPEDNVAVEFWSVAASAVTPFLQGWLGQKPRSPLTLLDLPDPADTPFETGALLATPLREPAPAANPGSLDDVLVHALTRAWITSPNSPHPPPAWLDEGVAHFMGTLWVEKQHGRDAALRVLESGRAALALAEPASPGESSGQPLAAAISPVYYRTKAAYVLWMLRDLAGDPALSAALSAYYSEDGFASDTQPAKKPDLVKGTGFSPNLSDKESARALAPEGSSSGDLSFIPANSESSRTSDSFEKLLEATAVHPNLRWFFADWVDADKGLPDLSIQGVFPTPASAGNWLVAINLSNAGYAAAELPVTVRSASASVTHRTRIPAHDKVTERILIQGKPTEVQANDGAVPETQASIHITNLDDPAANPPGAHPPELRRR